MEIDINRIIKLRTRTFELIKKELEIDSHCKRYEGEIDISFGGYFDQAGLTITLHCYVAPINGRKVIFSNLEGWELLLDKWEKEIRGEYQCSGNTNDCPENEGFGCPCTSISPHPTVESPTNE
jgi:hypothetical protein